MLKTFVVTLAIIGLIGLSLQDNLISSNGPSNRSNNGVVFTNVTKKSEKFDSPRKIVLEFDIDLGDQRLNLINFTTPFSTLDTRMKTESVLYDHRITARFEISNYAEYQIDATVFVEP